MKKWMKAVLSGLVAAALTVGMLAGLTRLVERKYAYSSFDPFYRQKEDYDVLFLGSSHMINGVSPMELWDNYGIVSYNLAGHQVDLPVSYWILKNALEYTSPQIVVVDCYYISKDKTSFGADLSHVVFDRIPASRTKAEAVVDLLGNKKRVPEFLWDFCLYHDRWNGLTAEDFDRTVFPEKGGGLRVDVAQVHQYVPENDVPELGDTMGTQYLRKIIEECQSRDIKVLLIYLPYAADGKGQAEKERAARIAEEYSVDYIDFLQTDIANWNTDYYNSGHLNFSGGVKITNYIGQYLVDHYAAPDRREDPSYANWYEDFEKYKKYKLQTMSSETFYDWSSKKTVKVGLKAFFMLLSDKDFSYCVFLGQSDLWKNDAVYPELLKNIGIDPDGLADEPVLAVVDNEAGKVCYLCAGDVTETGFGQAAFTVLDGTYSVQIDGRPAMVLMDKAGAGAVVIENTDGSIAALGQFSVTDARQSKIG